MANRSLAIFYRFYRIWTISKTTTIVCAVCTAAVRAKNNDKANFTLDSTKILEF